MRVPLHWLNEYIKTPLSPQQLGDVLTKAGLEVDEIIETPEGSVLEISLTPNLGHCASLLGIARELSAATQIPHTLRPVDVKEEEKEAAEVLKIDIASPKECSHYASRVIEGVKVVPSPLWMQKRLEAAGVRPINHVVDVTNYVMLELGHPLHAFDADKLNGMLVVRQALEGESLKTLDGKERELVPGDLVIGSSQGVVALAGIMGGANSEVTEGTTRLVLEAACFDGRPVRRTSKRLTLMTEASKRFERGVDREQLKRALDRAAILITEIGGGAVLRGYVEKFEEPLPEKILSCRISRVNLLLGTQLSRGEVEEFFTRLEILPQGGKGDALLVKVPSYRNDIKEEVDLIEEVARIYGFDNIQTAMPRFVSSRLPHQPLFLFEREVRSRLIGEGLQEFITCDLIGPSLLDIVRDDTLKQETLVKVLNPTSVEQSILRTSLLPGLLQLVKYNRDHQNHDIGGFEIGRIHFKSNLPPMNGSEPKERAPREKMTSNMTAFIDGELGFKEGDSAYKEQSVVGIVLTGKSAPHFWGSKDTSTDFFQLKGIVENLLKELRIPSILFKNTHMNVLHPGRQAAIVVGDMVVGTLGEVHPSLLRRLDVPQTILFAELNLHDLMASRLDVVKMQPLPIYPGSERDLTLSVKEDLPIDEIFKGAYAVGSKYLEKVSLIDIYRSEKLGSGVKNVTVRFFYRDREKTMAQEIVDEEHRRIVTALQSGCDYDKK